MIIDYLTLVVIPLIVGLVSGLIAGFVLQLSEYFMIQPLKRILEERSQEKRLLINSEKEKKQPRKPILQNVKDGLLGSTLLNKSMEVLAKISPKKLGFVVGIFFLALLFRLSLRE